MYHCRRLISNWWITVEATVKLVEKLGGKVVGIAFLIELEGLKGRDKLQG